MKFSKQKPDSTEIGSFKTTTVMMRQREIDACPRVKVVWEVVKEGFVHFIASVGQRESRPDNPEYEKSERKLAPSIVSATALAKSPDYRQIHEPRSSQTGKQTNIFQEKHLLYVFEEVARSAIISTIGKHVFMKFHPILQIYIGSKNTAATSCHNKKHDTLNGLLRGGSNRQVLIYLVSNYAIL